MVEWEEICYGGGGGGNLYLLFVKVGVIPFGRRRRFSFHCRKEPAQLWLAFLYVQFSAIAVVLHYLLSSSLPLSPRGPTTSSSTLDSRLSLSSGRSSLFISFADVVAALIRDNSFSAMCALSRVCPHCHHVIFITTSHAWKRPPVWSDERERESFSLCTCA